MFIHRGLHLTLHPSSFGGRGHSRVRNHKVSNEPTNISKVMQVGRLASAPGRRRGDRGGRGLRRTSWGLPLTITVILKKKRKKKTNWLTRCHSLFMTFTLSEAQGMAEDSEP